MTDDDIEQILNRFVLGASASRSLGARRRTALVRDHWADLFAIQAQGFSWARIAKALSDRLTQNGLDPLSEGTLKKLCHRARDEAQTQGLSRLPAAAPPSVSQPVGEATPRLQPSARTPASQSGAIELTNREIGRRADMKDFLDTLDTESK
jgi:hypothetical protein